jgi:hypothetical protein
MKPVSDVRKRLAVALGAAVLVSLIFVFASRDPGEKPAPKGPGMVEFRDEEGGFSVSYPRSWQELSRRGQEDPFERLLVGPPGTDDTLSVKVVPLPGRVVINSKTPQEDINAIEASLDQLIDQLPGLVEVLQRQRLIIAGTPGWYYLYKFRDGDQQGIHFRYFMFEGDKEYMMTFQAFPEDHYANLAPVWDEILGTFNFKLEASPSPGQESPSPGQESPSPGQESPSPGPSPVPAASPSPAG